ncbi:MAG: hypothetical protein LBG83_00600 [Oscillospiraceae bacterium]|nr:hypothetical protein [Oscillospiraceae bacterium]
MDCFPIYYVDCNGCLWVPYAIPADDWCECWCCPTGMTGASGGTPNGPGTP